MLSWSISHIIDLIKWWLAERAEKKRVPVPPRKPVEPKLPAQTDFAGRIVSAMNKLGYRVDEGADVYNIVYIKNVDKNGKQRPDRGRYKYDDLRVVLQVVNGKAEIVEAWDATVDPFFSVNSGGAAQIECPSQQRAWIPGMHLGKEFALCQWGGPVWINRDSNGNFVRDAGDKRLLGDWGINQHSGNSAGCLTVPSASDQRDFMRIVTRDRRYLADKKRFIFTTTILPASAVQ